MARISNSEKLRRIHEESLVEFNAIQSVMRDERLQCLQDRRFLFIAGAQWEGPLGEQFENKPKLEVNKIAMAVDQIINDYRNNRIDVNFVSKDGSTDDDLADTCAALYRADEQDSQAEEAYSNAFEEAVGGGFGAWRVKTRYEDDETEEEDDPQRIMIEPLYDADSTVFFDLNARRQDKSDARTCYVITPLTYSEYMDRYPDDDPSSWPKIVHQGEFDWLKPNIVYLAEKFQVEETSEVIHIYRGPGPDGDEVSHTQEELDEDPELENSLLATGYRQVKEKKVKRRRIHKYLMNGMGILEDYGYIAGKEIPIVPLYGKRVFIDNVERCRGHVRLAKDAQRIKNMLLSKLAEISALSSVEKPIMTPEQTAGLQQIWAGDNITNNPYLPINPVTDAEGNLSPQGPVGWTKSPSVPPATAALHQQVDEDMKEILGNPDQGEKVVSHVSGAAVQAIQQRVDSKSFLFISNMGKAIRRCGQIWLGIAPEVYNQAGRSMKAVGPRNEVSRVKLKQPAIGEDGRLVQANDLSRAHFDVAVEVGPSSETKREASVRSGTDMLAVTQDPETQAVITLFILTNMTGEGIEDVREWARQQLVKKGVLKPTPEEQKQLAAAAQQAQQQPPSPMDQLALAQAHEAQAKVQNIVEQAKLTAARTAETKARAIATVAGVELDHKKAAVDAVATLASVDLDHAKAKVDAAEKLHGMLTDSMQASPGTGGPTS